MLHMISPTFNIGSWWEAAVLTSLSLFHTHTHRQREAHLHLPTLKAVSRFESRLLRYPGQLLQRPAPNPSVWHSLSPKLRFGTCTLVHDGCQAGRGWGGGVHWVNPTHPPYTYTHISSTQSHSICMEIWAPQLESHEALSSTNSYYLFGLLPHKIPATETHHIFMVMSYHTAPSYGAQTFVIITVIPTLTWLLITPVKQLGVGYRKILAFFFFSFLFFFL